MLSRVTVGDGGKMLVVKTILVYIFIIGCFVSWRHFLIIPILKRAIPLNINGKYEQI